jgi:hypothetical protein
MLKATWTFPLYLAIKHEKIIANQYRGNSGNNGSNRLSFIVHTQLQLLMIDLHSTLKAFTETQE